MKTMEVVVYEELVFTRSLFRARKIGMWFLVWSFFTLLSINVGVLGGSLRKDVEGLMEFKKAITRDPRGVLREWENGNNNKLNPCHWYGVSCSEWRVRRIDLSYSQLTGNLTMERFLSQMDMLEVLVLKGNNFTFNGFFNTTTSYCSISALDISDNNLGGGIDLGFVGSCQKLVSLNLSYNSLISIGVSKVSYGLLSLDVSHNLLSGDGGMSGIIGNNNCKSLQYLDLSHNKINGTIPDGLSKCDQLVSLNLSANLLVDGIPRDLINCNSSPQHNCSSQLKILDLSNNAFSGPLSAIFESCPPNLELLNLSSNSLSGRIPSSLGDCRELKLLNLSTNKLTGPIPPSMGGLESIEQLIMSKNNLNGVIPAELGKTCATLKKLDLSQNLNLQGSIPLSFSMCSSLHTLDLSKNQLVGTFPKELVSNLKSLKVLQLSYNNMTGTLPISLSNCTTLEVLDLSSNKISGTFPPELCSPSSSLQRLLLADNWLIGPLPPEISKCKNLRSLDLSFNSLSGTIPAVFGSMPNLRDLVIWLNDLEGEIPPEICDNGVLETLILNNNFLTGNVPEALAKCKSLVWLSLSNNRLTGPIPASLGTLDKLAILQLGNNTLTGPIPPELGNCSGLIWLDLNSNLLNGSIPATLSKQSGHVMPGAVSGKSFAFVRNEGGISCKGAGGLLEFAGIRPEELASSRMLRSCASTRVYLGTTVYRFKENGTLMYLDLSYNFLSGEIPDSLGTMMFMEVFNVAHNQLSGIIPSSLGGMKEVGIMDLSYNNFHGFIPGTLGALSLLSDLDVSNNNLTGPIPSSGQLMTFPTSRYANNSGLCGLPLPACGSQANGGGESDRQGSTHRDRALAGSIALGIFIAMVCIVGLTYIAVRTRKEKKQEEMRDKYMDSLPTSGSGSWKLSGVLEPLSINVATFEKPLRKLTFAHLLEATNGFSADSLIGSGGFGDVYKAQLKDGSVVAIKKLIQVSGQGDREFTAEMETIGKIKHRNLVPLLGYCKVGDERLLVYEYMKWGSLENVLHDKGGANLDWTARKKIAIGSARGLAFLHHSCIPHIIHRDMKSSNVLLDENLEPRVSDFGMARLMNALDTHLSVSSLAGTPGYVPPEYYQSFRCTTKGDVYSYGVILLELLSGRRPIDPDAFGDNNLVGWMKQLVKVKKTAEVFDPVLLQDKSLEIDLYHHLRIACECLDDRPWRRPTMIQVMAMFRELQTDGEAELDEFALPEDVSVHEEKLT